jgi:putative ABC transport system permease protein
MFLGEQILLTVVSFPLGLLAGREICAMLTYSMQSELYRMPLVISSRTYAVAVLVVTAASAVSGVLILGRLRRLDLLSVLKARE